MLEKQSPLDRLNYKGNIKDIVENLCVVYRVGKLVDYEVIGIGYEDCNIIVETETGKYVAKVFSKERSPEIVDRYIEVMKNVLAAGVHHPELIKTLGGGVVHTLEEDNSVKMVLMKFVEGKTFFDMDRKPDEQELDDILKEIAKISEVTYRPTFLFDSWAILNIEAMFEKVKRYILPEDVLLVEKVIERFKEISIDELPHGFVHGDFTKTNVIKSTDGKIYIIDFSVSNWYPRIQELAVVCANLLYSETEPTTLTERVNLVIERYGKTKTLTDAEKENLYAYALAGVAMEFMGAHQEKFIKGNNTSETDYWLNLGRNSLRSELEIK